MIDEVTITFVLLVLPVVLLVAFSAGVIGSFIWALHKAWNDYTLYKPKPFMPRVRTETTKVFARTAKLYNSAVDEGKHALAVLTKRN